MARASGNSLFQVELTADMSGRAGNRMQRSNRPCQQLAQDILRSDKL
jgi:hypothetical protein